MRIIPKLAASAVLVFALSSAAAVQAKDCSGDRYCSPDTPTNPATDSGTDTDVSPGSAEAPATGTETDGAPAGELPISDELPATAEAPSGSLPITGSDVVGIAAIGAAALGLGTVLVRRSRTMKPAA